MNEYMKQIIEGLVEKYGPKAIDLSIDYAKNRIKGFVQSFKAANMANMHYEEVQVLDKKSLVDIGRKYCVEESDGVATMKTVKDNANYVYLAYVLNRELLPVETNSYVIIKAAALSPDVLALFEDNELIILK